MVSRSNAVMVVILFLCMFAIVFLLQLRDASTVVYSEMLLNDDPHHHHHHPDHHGNTSSSVVAVPADSSDSSSGVVASSSSSSGSGSGVSSILKQRVPKRKFVMKRRPPLDIAELQKEETPFVWEKKMNSDCPGWDVGRCGDEAHCKALCESKPRCSGFNTNGWLKKLNCEKQIEKIEADLHLWVVRSRPEFPKRTMWLAPLDERLQRMAQMRERFDKEGTPCSKRRHLGLTVITNPVPRTDQSLAQQMVAEAEVLAGDFERICTSNMLAGESNEPPFLSVVASISAEGETVGLMQGYEVSMLAQSIMKSASISSPKATMEVVVVIVARTRPREDSDFCRQAQIVRELDRDPEALDSRTEREAGADCRLRVYFAPVDEHNQSPWRLKQIGTALAEGRKVAFANVGDYYSPWWVERAYRQGGRDDTSIIFWNSADSRKMYLWPALPMCAEDICIEPLAGAEEDIGNFAVDRELLLSFGGYPPTDCEAEAFQLIVAASTPISMEPRTLKHLRENTPNFARWSNVEALSRPSMSTHDATFTYSGYPFFTSIIATGGGRVLDLTVGILAMLLQTDQDWEALVVNNDGPDATVAPALIKHRYNDPRIHYHTVPKNRDWGHPAREEGVKRSRGEYVMITNDDNYNCPFFFEIMRSFIVLQPGNMNIYHFAMVHNHNIFADHLITTLINPGAIDMAAAVVKGSTAREIGFPFRSWGADWEYYSNIKKLNPEAIASSMQNMLIFAHN